MQTQEEKNKTKRNRFPFLYTNACFGKTEEVKRQQQKGNSDQNKTRKRCLPKNPTTKQQEKGQETLSSFLIPFFPTSLPSLTLCNPEVVVLFDFFESLG